MIKKIITTTTLLGVLLTQSFAESVFFKNSRQTFLPYSKEDTIFLLKNNKKINLQDEYTPILLSEHLFLSVDPKLKEYLYRFIKNKVILNADFFNLYDLTKKQTMHLKSPAKEIGLVLIHEDLESFHESEYLYYRAKVGQAINSGEYALAFEYLYILSERFPLKYVDEDLLILSKVATQKAINNKEFYKAYVISSQGLEVAKTMYKPYKQGSFEIELLNLKINSRNLLLKEGVFISK